MRSVACVFLLAAAASAQTVEGAIVDTATGRGIAGARVTLSRAGERASQPIYSAIADSNGHFRIENVKEGAYIPRYSADHFFAADGFPAGAEFQVVSAASPVRLEGRLAPNAHITGRVLDGRGDPVPNAAIDLTLPQAFWAAKTDSEGRFDLDSVIAGPSG
jgi:5-hydroxyisourate hydrolase-like protein (transthyretin family)